MDENYFLQARCATKKTYVSKLCFIRFCSCLSIYNEMTEYDLELEVHRKIVNTIKSAYSHVPVIMI